jgi:hypothetical protein
MVIKLPAAVVKVFYHYLCEVKYYCFKVAYCYDKDVKMPLIVMTFAYCSCEFIYRYF